MDIRQKLFYFHWFLSNEIKRMINLRDKSVVLIDGGYSEKITKEFFAGTDRMPRKIDYGKVGPVLAEKHDSDFLRTYYYTCPAFILENETEAQKSRRKKRDSFISALKQTDQIYVKLGRLRRFKKDDGTDQFVQKGVDVKLAVDALKLALKGKINKSIFITGDSDFVPVIEAIKEEGISTILYYHPNAVNLHLQESVDVKREIDAALISEVELKK